MQPTTTLKGDPTGPGGGCDPHPGPVPVKMRVGVGLLPEGVSPAWIHPHLAMSATRVVVAFTSAGGRGWQAAGMGYPSWSYFPRNVRPAGWVGPFVDSVAAQQPMISTLQQQGPKSDEVLQTLAPAWKELGFLVETTKSAADRIRRPVLFGEEGREAVSYEIDAWHDGDGIAVEVEAGRGTQNNADYRDVVRASLLLDARFFALLMPLRYAPPSLANNPVWGYRRTYDLLDALFASQRLRLPFEGVLLLGY